MAKHFITLVCMCTVVVTSAWTCAADLPNIVLLMGDDHGWDETHFNGHPHLKTPALDEMAAAGLRLDRFYSAHPTCSPTRGSIITGRHPARYGTFTPNRSIRPEEISVAQILAKAGYACAHFGKWHLGPVKAESPTNPGAMGFEKWLSHDNFFELNPFLSRNGGPPIQFQGESSEILVEETIRFIESAKNGNKPFFAVVWFGSPHEPYSGLDKDLELYRDLPERYQHETVGLTSNETGRPIKRPLREVLQERYAEITAMDRAIGQLRDWLDEEGLRKNTLLWYCGDNGTPSGGIVTSPFRGKKATMYEGGIRVPGIIEWPNGIPKPKVSNVNAVTTDMLPTICELVGQPVPNRVLDGISLTELFQGELPKRPQPIFFWRCSIKRDSKQTPYIDPKLQAGTTPLVKMMDDRFTRNFTNFQYTEVAEQDFGGPRVALDNQYKLILGADGESSIELFDLDADRAEKNNLADDHPAIASELSQQLRKWQTSVLKSLTGADYQ